MRTILTTVSAFIMIYTAVPQRVCAQAHVIATVTATVISSVSLELTKSNAVITEEKNPFSINFRGTGHILVVVDSKEMKSSNILQLTTEKPTSVIILSSPQTGKTSVTYLSS